MSTNLIGEEFDDGEEFRPVFPLPVEEALLLESIVDAFAFMEPWTVRLGGDVDDEDLDEEDKDVAAAAAADIVIPWSKLVIIDDEDPLLRLKWFRSLKSESDVAIVAIEIVLALFEADAVDPADVIPLGDDEFDALDDGDDDDDVDKWLFRLVGGGNDWIGRFELVADKWWCVVPAFARMEVIGESMNGHELLLLLLLLFVLDAVWLFEVFIWDPLRFFPFEL